MSIFFFKHKKLILSSLLILLISSLGIFVLGAEETTAGIGEAVANAGKSLLGGFLLMIQEIIGGFVAWLAGLAQGIIGFTDIQKAQMVQDGWQIVRDFVNMFFVLVLLAIALATILRLETYGMKALLPKLIIAALLINFSLVLAGVFIDFAGVLTDFFIKDSTNFFENIADEMGLTHIQTTSAQDSGGYWECCDSSGGNCSGKHKTSADCTPNCTCIGCSCSEYKPLKVDWSKIQGDRFWKVCGALFLSITFTVIAAFVFGALAVLLLVRVIVIWFLLILAPIAWFFWILPATKHLFEQWWNTFIKWVFFAPAAIFFIWLSVNSWLKFIQGKSPKLGGEIITGMKEVITDEAIQGSIIPNVMRPENLIQFLLACGMLLGSLIVAQKMGIAGAQGAIGIAKRIGGKVSGVAAVQRRWKTRKAAREEEAKEAAKGKARLARVSGARQWMKEHLRPTARGRAEARARKNEQITNEARRMGNTMDLTTVASVAGKRVALTKAARMRKLAAQALMANTSSPEYTRMMSRRPPPPPGTRKRTKINNLANRIYAQKRVGRFARYTW